MTGKSSNLKYAVPERLTDNAVVPIDRFGPQVIPVCAYGLSLIDRRGKLTRTNQNKPHLVIFGLESFRSQFLYSSYLL